ncbi:MAG: VPLPA-CTERM sorting domain-containing protein [Candidatus Methylumidiphilus sp.]
MKKSAVVLAVAATLLGAASTAQAHQYYNLTGAGTLESGNAAIGFGIANSINGTDGVSAGSNVATGSPFRVANGTNTFDLAAPSANNLIPGTGTAAATATEIPGNLPYNWYSGQHTTATGYTKREHYTGTSATDNSSPIFSGFISGAVPTLPNGVVLPGTIANWNPASLPSSLWKAYTDKNGGTNAATWGTIIADPVNADDHAYLAVAGNSASTGLGLDYGLLHISCGTNTADNNCASAGDVLTTITIKNDTNYSSNNGLLDVALYRNVDTSTTSNRNAASTIGETAPQGSNLGAPIWTASMSSASDILYYSFIFNQAEWNATGTAGLETNGFYTLVIGAHGGSATNGIVYDAFVTTSPVPVPAAVWLFGSAFAGFSVFGRRKQVAKSA